MSQYLDTVYEAILAGVEEDTLAALLANWDCLNQDEKRFVKVLRAASAAGGGGAGDITGPATSTDNALPLWDGVGGDTLQDSSITSPDGSGLNVPGILKLGAVLSQASFDVSALTGDRTIAIQDANGTVAFLADLADFITAISTDELTNKRVVPRIGTVVSSATPSIDVDDVDQFNITALATAITSLTTNLSGTPTDGQKLTIRYQDNGTNRAITHGASFRDCTALMLTTTTAGKISYEGFIWNEEDSIWDCVASGTQP